MGGCLAKAPGEGAAESRPALDWLPHAESFARAAGGSFEDIFERFARPVASFLFQMVGDRSLAEDLAQDTFIRAYWSMARKREETPASAWLFAIAHRVALEALRRRQRKQREVMTDDFAPFDGEAQSPHPEARLLDNETHALIGRALMALPADQRSVFVLKLVHHLSYEQIARATGYSIAKLKSDLHRARFVMRRRLEPLLASEAHERRRTE